MEVTKAPLPDAGATRGGATPAPQQGAGAPAAGSPAAGSPAAAPPGALHERVDIQPLDVAAALQILIAEVRTELQLPLGVLQVQSPSHAAQAVIHLLLDAMPADVAEPARWLAASNGVEAVVQSALDQAVESIAAWRNVPHAVVEVAREARGLVAAQWSDEPQSPLWLRPEWQWLAPRIRRHWRRRRYARRGLTDPDSLDPGDSGNGRPDSAP